MVWVRGNVQGEMSNWKCRVEMPHTRIKTTKFPVKFLRPIYGVLHQSTTADASYDTIRHDTVD